MHAIAAPTTPNSTHGSNQGIIFSTSCFRARILITCIVIYLFFCQFVHSQAVCMNELHSPNSINGPFIASLRWSRECLSTLAFSFFCICLPLDCNCIPAALWVGNFSKWPRKRPVFCGIAYFDDCKKKKFHKIKFGLETTDQTRTHTRTSTVCKLTHSQFAVHWGILSPSFSHTHTCTHTDLHSLIWVDSGNHSSELAGGPGSGGGVEGGERGGGSKWGREEQARWKETAEEGRKEKRKFGEGRKEKGKFPLLLSYENTGRREDLKPLDLMN